MKELKIGDAVAVYCVEPNQEEYGLRIVCNITEVSGAIVKVANSQWFHQKQCRLLKKKERRRVWGQYQFKTKKFICATENMPSIMINTNELVEFIEVKKK